MARNAVISSDKPTAENDDGRYLKDSRGDCRSIEPWTSAIDAILVSCTRISVLRKDNVQIQFTPAASGWQNRDRISPAGGLALLLRTVR